MTTTYTNPGKGLVLENASAVDVLAGLFEQADEWTSEELNAALGWQFSQAIYGLRKRLRKEKSPMTIETIRYEGRRFGYRYAPHQGDMQEAV